jgi:hypothetical protein
MQYFFSKPQGLLILVKKRDFPSKPAFCPLGRFRPDGLGRGINKEADARVRRGFSAP